MEDKLIGIPNKKEVTTQIHSIKRKVTESGRFIFDAEKNKSHHGDIFWGIAMASSFGERAVRRSIIIPGATGERIIIPPRIIPITSARSFIRTTRPRALMPMDISVLKRPDDLKKLHLKVMNS